ncbi:hypothetical protein NDU88_001406 [Pleurodeles waltl]|uniref:Uncharacterized protein n=1 Tax=Pleurodeles waltl TaxID=8319 RepID=A0AAV7W045_PLEWA|nr:hypothetical protein NDU88_001406 [Pleurodeles waltl]
MGVEKRKRCVWTRNSSRNGRERPILPGERREELSDNRESPAKCSGLPSCSEVFRIVGWRLFLQWDRKKQEHRSTQKGLSDCWVASLPPVGPEKQ